MIDIIENQVLGPAIQQGIEDLKRAKEQMRC
jgi:hypothetical protein